jgi:hypothetical protein
MNTVALPVVRWLRGIDDQQQFLGLVGDVKGDSSHLVHPHPECGGVAQRENGG